MRFIILTSLFFTMLGATVAFAAEDPKWEELNALFGLNIESEKVKQVVQTYNLSKGAKGDSGSFTPKHQAYTLMFRSDKISTIILQVSPWPKGYGDPGWRPYAGDLPSQIKPSSRIKDLRTLFGESHTKQGHTWISDGLDIWVHFRDDGSISELYVSQTDSKKKKPAQQDAPSNGG
jgi:hypothetical protein